MAGSPESRKQKPKRNLIEIIGWTLFIISMTAVAWRFISGNTLQQQAKVAEEKKQQNALAQSAGGNPKDIAAMLDQQADQARKQAAQTADSDGKPATDGGQGGNPDLALPAGRQPSGAPPASAGAGSSGSMGNVTTQAEQATRSDFGVYEEGKGSGVSGGLSMGNAMGNVTQQLNDQLQRLQQQSQNPGNAGASNAAMLEKLVQAQQAGINKASETHNASLEWLTDQKGQTADETPLTATPVNSDYLLMEGTPIRIALGQNIRSDLPGEITAMVTRDVYDSLGNGHKLLCYGTKLIGKYSSQISPGQDRVLFAFTSMRFLSGARVQLHGMPGSDAMGAAGAEADVDRHFFRIYGSALAVGTVAMLAGRASNSGSNVTINLGSGNSNNGSAVATQALSQTVQQMLQRNQNISDTLSLNYGQELMLVTNRDMVLPPEQTGCSQ